MTGYQLRILAAFARTDEFFKKSGAKLLTSPRNTELVEELGRILSRLAELAPIQNRSPKAVKVNAQRMNRLAKELRSELLKVARTARVLEDEAPELRPRFSMPRSPGFSELRKTSRAFIANSTPEVQALFIEAELPPKYLQVIADKLQTFESELSQKTDGRKKTVSATTEVAAHFRRGMVVLRKLDAAIRNVISDPVKLDAWRLARNVELLHRPPPKYRLKGIQAAEPFASEESVVGSLPEVSVEDVVVATELSEETPVEETPVEEIPIEETPIEETPVEETPVEETPVEETPVEVTPVEVTPVEVTPVEVTPVEETPIEVLRPEAEPEETPEASPNPPSTDISPEPGSTGIHGEAETASKKVRKSTKQIAPTIQQPIQDDFFGNLIP